MASRLPISQREIAKDCERPDRPCIEEDQRPSRRCSVGDAGQQQAERRHLPVAASPRRPTSEQHERGARERPGPHARHAGDGVPAHGDGDDRAERRAGGDAERDGVASASRSIAWNSAAAPAPSAPPAEQAEQRARDAELDEDRPVGLLARPGRGAKSIGAGPTNGSSSAASANDQRRAPDPAPRECGRRCAQAAGSRSAPCGRLLTRPTPLSRRSSGSRGSITSRESRCVACFSQFSRLPRILRCRGRRRRARTADGAALAVIVHPDAVQEASELTGDVDYARARRDERFFADAVDRASRSPLIEWLRGL